MSADGMGPTTVVGMEDGALTPEILERIRTLPLFAGLDRTGLAGLLGGAELCSVERDAVMFRQGEPADRFYIVLSGRVVLLVMDNAARESVIEVVKPGDTFGEEAIFDHGLFPFGARVIEPARLVHVPAASFLASLATDFKFVMMMLASMSAHLRFLVRQVGELKLKTTEQRLGSYLLAQTLEGQASATVLLPYDKKILASQLGMTPESLSRALAKLRDVGVSSGNSSLTIADVARLRAFCRESDISE
ncbi:MAG: cyclic nucleotide-binding domain-containing protein [Alphaproteobacteria bacterium]